MSSSKFDFLRDTVPEFAFLEGIDGGKYSEDFIAASTEDVLVMFNRALKEVHQGDDLPVNTKASPFKRVLPPADAFVLLSHPIWQASEGAGKSSVVKRLVDTGCTVVFCSKTNDQLVEQQRGFAARWPNMRISRYVSKARHLQEWLAVRGMDFTPVYYQSTSPYASAAIDEPSTRQALREVLDDAGHTAVDHHELFELLYTRYKSPTIVGLDTDVVLLTIAAFQSFCASKYRPWWEALGLLSGRTRTIERDGKTIKRNEGLSGIVVIIDDPDRTDFDFRRLVEDEHAVKLHQARTALPKYQEPWRTVRFWRDQGMGDLLANEMAMHHEQRAVVHDLESFQQRVFEHRPEAMHLGYRLRRGFQSKTADDDSRPDPPKMYVLTTEHVTARLALATLRKTGIVPEYRSNPNSSIWQGGLEVTANCHVTLLSTRLVRKKNHILLVLITELLRREFPDEDIELIANGLGCDLNLSNNRGRNDLADKTTIIKLSIPNPNMALNLWAQFPDSEKPGVLNTILLADLANQALGRNQGNRFRGKPAIVLVDPIYAKQLVASDLLRYACTPWSSPEPVPRQVPEPTGTQLKSGEWLVDQVKPSAAQLSKSLRFHHSKTAFEARLMELLVPETARNIGLGPTQYGIGETLPLKQRAMYEAWLDTEGMSFRWPRTIIENS